jgi:hypothetical protein
MEEKSKLDTKISKYQAKSFTIAERINTMDSKKGNKISKKTTNTNIK